MKPSYLFRAFSGCVLFFSICLFGCSPSEFDELFPGGGNSESGELISLNIGEVIIPGYNEDPSTRSVSDSSSEHGDLFNEWVPIDECNVTRGIDAVSEMCVMRLCPDSVVSAAGPSTRANLSSGAKIRLIAFKTSDKSFAGVGDYQTSGSTLSPIGKGLKLTPRQNYTIVGYTFNSSASLPSAPSSYGWQNTAISIPNMDNDFLTCSASISNLSSSTNKLSLSFSHQLSKMSIVLKNGRYVSSIGSASNVTISNGGSSGSWKVGNSAVQNPSGASQKFSTTETGTATAVRINPNRTNQKVSVTFPSIAINGMTKSNITITSASAVSLLPGKTYTMTITFNTEPGISIPEADITQCYGTDKSTLASVIFAPGNLIQPGETTGAPTFTGSASDYGHYYCWMSDWMGNGSTSRNGKDPCQSVIGQGTKWYTPSYSLLQVLAKCTNKTLTNKGMWFGGSGKGLFLPVAGYRFYTNGSGLTATNYAGTEGYYLSKEERTSTSGYGLLFRGGTATSYTSNKTNGLSVRCVQGSK